MQDLVLGTGQIQKEHYGVDCRTAGLHTATVTSKLLSSTENKTKQEAHCLNIAQQTPKYCYAKQEALLRAFLNMHFKANVHFQI